MPAHEPFVPGYVYGTGEEQNWYEGVPQPASFQGMSPWWTVPTNWYIRWINGQIFVSPTWNFVAPTFAAKIDQDGCMKFQFPYGINRNGLPTIPMNQFIVTYPPSTITAQCILFEGDTPGILPAVQTLPALAYNRQNSLYGWNTVAALWLPISTSLGANVVVPANAPLEAGSTQIVFSSTLTFPTDSTLPALFYNVAGSLWGWDTLNQNWIPILTPDGLTVTPTLSGIYDSGQIAFALDVLPITPSDPTDAQLYYGATGTLYGWNTNTNLQIAMIS